MRTLIDSHGRRVRKLRLSLTDKCNLRCHYCMPLDATFRDEKENLSPDEYADIIQDLCGYGLQELRITGGEPLMRKSFREIIQKLSSLPLKKIAMTTNGVFLDQYFEDLLKHRVHHLNVSLDSLNEKTFEAITHGKHLIRILNNIETARKLQFEVKINVVSMRGVNDHELFDFVEYSKTTGVEVRFLEIMRIGEALGKQEDQFLSSMELISRLKEKFSLTPVVKDYDSTSTNYILDNGARIGFISSESNAFCGQCSRWRLSADGVMRACLLKDDGISLKNTTTKEREAIYETLLGMKPFMRPKEVTHQMNAIGG